MVAGTGLVKEFGAVNGKACYRDCILEWLIDDNHDYLQYVTRISPLTSQGRDILTATKEFC